MHNLVFYKTGFGIPGEGEEMTCALFYLFAGTKVKDEQSIYEALMPEEVKCSPGTLQCNARAEATQLRALSVSAPSSARTWFGK